jgi:ribonuclease HI
MSCKVTIYSDGGARGNPGPAAIGAKINIEGEIIEISKYIGKATNNVAEYRAIIESLKETIKILKKDNLLKKAEVNCYLDSELVVKQINREYKVKNPVIFELFIKLNNLLPKFKKIRFKHIKRKLNKEADLLVNLALNKVKKCKP